MGSTMLLTLVIERRNPRCYDPNFFPDGLNPYEFTLTAPGRLSQYTFYIGALCTLTLFITVT